MYQEKVTVITPTCNRLEGLKEALASVYSQSYQNWEYFIVSDGYDTRVRQLVKTLHDRRVKYFFTLKTEYAGHLQRNIAFKFASGKYVFCLDDDNIIYEDYIKKMVNGFVNEEIGYVICKIKYDDIGILYPQLPFQVGSIDMLNYMVRTNLVRQIGGWIPFWNYCADFNLINKISKISKGNFVPEVLGWHRKLQASSSLNFTLGFQKSVSMSQLAGKIIELSMIKNIIKKVVSKFGIHFYKDKSIRTNINRIIYQVLCKTWLKF